MLWWKWEHLQISSYEPYVYYLLSSEVNIKWKKFKSFVTRKVEYFELGIICTDSYVYYLTYGFIATFNLPTCAFILATCDFLF